MTLKKLETLSEHIRTLWIEARRQFDWRTSGKPSDWGARYQAIWDGGTDRVTGKDHTCKWDKIAAFVIEHDLEPTTLIRAIFDGAYAFPPNPTAAYGRNALSKYRQFVSPLNKGEMREQISTAFASQKEQFKLSIIQKQHYDELKPDDAWRVTLVEASSGLSPLFRYCVGVNRAWPDIYEQYENSARRQYHQDRELYDAIWRDWIPNKIKTDMPKEYTDVRRSDETSETETDSTAD